MKPLEDVGAILGKEIKILRRSYLKALTLETPASQGYVTYKDSAQSSPVDGVGGSPSVTLSNNTTDTISGEVDLRFTKPASNCQGEGFAKDFTIEKKDLAKLVQLEVNLRLNSGTYSKGDLRIYIIQDPTGTPVVIEPVNVEIETGSTGIIIKHLVLFQAHFTIQTYRLCIHVASVSTSAYSIDFNNLKAWEQEKTYGAYVSDDKDFTSQVSISGVASYSTLKAYYSRFGNKCNARIYGALSSGANAVECRIYLPDGLVIKSDEPNQNLNLGIYGKLITSNAVITAPEFVLLGVPGNNYFTVSKLEANTPSHAATSNRNSSEVLENGISFLIVIENVPIQGWNTNMLLSSETINSPVSGRVTGNTAQSCTTNVTKIKFDNVTKDSHSMYNSFTGEIEIKYSGDYVFNIGQLALQSSSANILIYIDDTLFTYLGTAISATLGSGGMVLIPDLLRGQKVNFRLSDNLSTATGNPSVSYLDWFKLGSGSQTIAKDEVVMASYGNVSGQLISGNTTVLFSSKYYDTHAAYNTTNGIFTAPYSGRYLFKVTGQINSLNTHAVVFLYKNGLTTVAGQGTFSDFSGITKGSYLRTVELLKGETIRVNFSPNSGSANLETTEFYNLLEIERVG